MYATSRDIKAQQKPKGRATNELFQKQRYPWQVGIHDTLCHYTVFRRTHPSYLFLRRAPFFILASSVWDFQSKEECGGHATATHMERDHLCGNRGKKVRFSHLDKENGGTGRKGIKNVEERGKNKWHGKYTKTWKRQDKKYLSSMRKVFSRFGVPQPFTTSPGSSMSHLQ